MCDQFDPKAYFDRAEACVSTCLKWTEVDGLGPKYPLITLDKFKQRWEIIIWRCEVRFPYTGKLVAFEGHSRSADEKHLRQINYQFMKDDGELIFRVDTHGRKIPFTDCPHLHPGPKGEPIIEDGSSSLVESNVLRDFDFLRMWGWVQAYIQKEVLPWRQ